MKIDMTQSKMLNGLACRVEEVLPGRWVRVCGCAPNRCDAVSCRSRRNYSHQRKERLQMQTNMKIVNIHNLISNLNLHNNYAVLG